ncbi:unnamed protein product [Lathyrus oleraceus]|uniref:WRKY domain-containing protein n=1 Tax=Pisum sativum TaxID=3888 RepID=A0A9D4YEP5_PEA|nr:probable WRKY transcription factor 57 isoform X1 [Pisum sativum]XP_050905868.1 probable WRKY transcription factor 57 isoform X1 [Pisum sativum]KAI5437774.1 hypothetical protein KIW84_023769 [Pisum sativum]
MEDKDRAPPDPATAGEFIGNSSWSLGVDDSDGTHFFSGDRDRTMFGDIGWNLVPDQVGASEGSLPPVQTGSIEPAPTSSYRSNNQSISSSSSEDPPEKSTVSDEKPPEIPSKSKKKGQKRIRQPRFAFMTKSEVDHLEDGYRWRKYGQKAVKNSPFPRSYYRCTNSKCTVKKRVERSCEDPTIVVTTYEGQHCHHTVGYPRGGIISHEASFTGHFSPTMPQFYYPIQIPTESNTCTTPVSQHSQSLDDHEAGRSSSATMAVSDASLPQHPTDEGLLGDIVPRGMRSRDERNI